MNLIVAVDQNFGIGKDNKMPWHLRADMAYFKQMTLGKTVVMGRKTLESLPGGQPLKDRNNIVLSTAGDYGKEGVTVCRSPREVFLAAAKHAPDDVLVIGGASVYRTFLPYCTRAYVTKIQAAYETDAWFPNLDGEPLWEIETQGDEQTENRVSFRFTVYVNHDVKIFED